MHTFASGGVPYGVRHPFWTSPITTWASSVYATPLSASHMSLPMLSQSGLPRSARPTQYFGLLLASGLKVSMATVTIPSKSPWSSCSAL